MYQRVILFYLKNRRDFLTTPFVLLVKIMIKKILIAVGALGLSFMLTSCSKVINTVNGLSTFQSTISGSNYPFMVDEDGKLSAEYQKVQADKLIGGDENFSINLDSLFLRYLQASDPYIVVYSEAWMGTKVRPTDDSKLQRQILLLKDGVGFNAKLPISNLSLLGPVTLDNEAMDVYVSLNVVVLSKNDNKQTTELLDGLASAVSTAAPQYAVIAGAAAKIGRAIVAQNRDKVEFEHTFNFSPKKGLKQIYAGLDESFFPPLAESKIVVIKGENEHRLVPYQNWFYYIWPLNWYGHRPSNNSIRFETSHAHYKWSWLNNGAVNLIDEGATYSLVNAPFKIALEMLMPSDSYLLQKEVTSPDELIVKGSYLLRRLPLKDKLTVKKKSEQKAVISTDSGVKVEVGVGADDKIQVVDISSHNEEEGTFLHRLYSEKTHAILTIKRSAGTHGNFDSLLEKYRTHSEKLNDILADSSSSEKTIKEAFEAIKKAVIFEKKRKKSVELAKTNAGVDVLLKSVLQDDDGSLTADDKNVLQNVFWEQLSIESGKRLKLVLDNLIAIKDLKPDDFFKKFKDSVKHEKDVYWNGCQGVTKEGSALVEANRVSSWMNVLQTIVNYLYQNPNTRNYSYKITADFSNLRALDACKIEIVSSS